MQVTSHQRPATAHRTPYRVVSLLLAISVLAAVEVGQVMPPLALPLVAAADTPGEQPPHVLSLESLRGQVVYLDVWASWCGPCRESFPWMQQMHATYAGKGLRVIGLSVDERSADMAAFLARQQVDFLIAHDHDQTLVTTLGAPAMPTSYLIDREGVLRRVHVSFDPGDAPELERQIQELLR